MHVVTKTETINLFLGNNDCTCVKMDCKGALNVAISNSDPNQSDALCPVFTNAASTCYSPSTCHQFNDASFFHICEDNSSSRCIYRLCFGNVTEQLNGIRLDFFILNKIVCVSLSTFYNARVYIRSLMIKGN